MLNKLSFLYMVIKMKKMLLLISILVVSAASYAGPSPQTLTLQGVGSVTFPDPNTNSATVEPSVNENGTDSGDGNVITDSKNTITFDAYTNASSGIAQWVQNQMTEENIPWKDINMLTYKGGNVKPDSLSFALQGILSFSQNQVRYQCNNMIFGQGKNGSNSPWYVFSNVNNLNDTLTDYQDNKSTIIQCSDVADSSGSAVYFRFEPVNDSTFNISQIDMNNAVNQTSNVVCFTAKNQRDLQILNFLNTTVNVTPGENYTNTVTLKDNCLRVNANLKDSTDVQEWVKNQLNANGIQWTKYNMCSDPTKGEVPDQLELAIKGNLAFNYAGVNYTCNNLIFGKGDQSWNHVHSQDWWAFSNGNSQFIKGSNIVIGCTNNLGQNINFFLKQDILVAGNTFIITDMIKQCKQQKGSIGSCIPSLPSAPGGGDVPPVE
jgi:hypothetical protein